MSGRESKRIKIKKLKKVSKSLRADVVFPVGRTRTKLKKFCNGKRIGDKAAVYLTGVLEYLTAEVLKMAADAATDHKHKKIQPRDLMLALKMDQEFDTLTEGVVIPYSGTVPAQVGETRKFLKKVKKTKVPSIKEIRQRKKG